MNLKNKSEIQKTDEKIKKLRQNVNQLAKAIKKIENIPEYPIKVAEKTDRNQEKHSLTSQRVELVFEDYDLNHKLTFIKESKTINKVQNEDTFSKRDDLVKPISTENNLTSSFKNSEIGSLNKTKIICSKKHRQAQKIKLAPRNYDTSLYVPVADEIESDQIII